MLFILTIYTGVFLVSLAVALYGRCWPLYEGSWATCEQAKCQVTTSTNRYYDVHSRGATNTCCSFFVSFTIVIHCCRRSIHLRQSDRTCIIFIFCFQISLEEHALSSRVVGMFSLRVAATVIALLVLLCGVFFCVFLFLFFILALFNVPTPIRLAWQTLIEVRIHWRLHCHQ